MENKQVHPVVLVGGGPGSYDLITLRGQRRLEEADVILVDHLGPASELDKLCDVSTKEIVDVSKLPYGRQVSQEKTNAMLVEYAQQGKKVVRLKGGDPFVFGRGYEEMEALAAHGIPSEVVPGVSSAISVPGLAGVPVTLRGAVHSFSVISGHLPPGHPKCLNNYEALARTGGTLVVIMGVKNAAAICEALMSAGMDPATPAAAIQEGSTDAQRAFAATVETLPQVMADNEVAAPAVLVIGEVAGCLSA